MRRLPPVRLSPPAAWSSALALPARGLLLVHRAGVRFIPDALGTDLVFNGCAILAMLICAVLFGPIGPGGQPEWRSVVPTTRPP